MDGGLRGEEFPVYVPAGDHRLSGVVCAPASGGDLGAVLLAGSDSGRTHRNRMWVRAARGLAERGVPSLRVDYRGAGDSTGTARFDSEEPYAEDVVAAAGFLERATGVSRLVLVGSCFGGRSALAAAAALPEAVGVVAFSVFALVQRDRRPSRLRAQRTRWAYRAKRLLPGLRGIPRGRVRRAIDRRTGSETVVSPVLARHLAALLPRGQAWLVMGERSARLAGVRRLLEEVAAGLDAPARARAHLEVVPGVLLQGFRSLAEQDLGVSLTVDLATRVGGAEAAPAAGAGRLT